MIYVIGMRDKVPEGALVINTTSRDKQYGSLFSPFFLGPVKLWDGTLAKNVENAWQFSKVYSEHDNNGKPNKKWFEWSRKGFDDKWAHRYPAGKNRKPLYSWNGKQLDYISARKELYIPFYAETIKNSAQIKMLQSLSELTDIYLRDFDGYNHRELNMTWDEVIDNPNKKMGHAFVIAMMVENYI